jgi:hypothetical protein
VPIDAVDDTILDGPQPVTISASSNEYVSGSDSLQVEDHETMTLILAADAILEEGIRGQTIATLTRNTTGNELPLKVTLAASLPGELSVPSEVEIPADQASASFPVAGIYDVILNDTQTVTITAEAPGFESIDAEIEVLDSSGWHNPLDMVDVDNDDFVIPLDAIAAINHLNNPIYSTRSGELPDIRPPGAYFYDVNDDGYATPIDVAAVFSHLNRSFSQAEGESAQAERPESTLTLGPMLRSSSSETGNAARASQTVSTAQETTSGEESPVRASYARSESANSAVSNQRRSLVGSISPSDHDLEETLEMIAEEVLQAREKASRSAL